MTVLNCILLNFVHAGILCQVFESYSRDFEYSMDGIFRRIVPPVCPVCELPAPEGAGVLPHPIRFVFHMFTLQSRIVMSVLL